MHHILSIEFLTGFIIGLIAGAGLLFYLIRKAVFLPW